MPLDVDKTDLSKVRAKIETKFGAMNLEFFPNKAPNTVKNFVKLADSGFYNNLAFHRIVSGFMIQGLPQGRRDRRPRLQDQGGVQRYQA